MVLIIPFVLQVSAIVGVTAWLSIRNGQQAVNDVTRQLRQETTARVSREITDLLFTAQAINQHSAKTIQRDNLDLGNIRSVESMYWDYIHTFPFIRGLGAGNQAGDILAMFHRGEPGNTTYFLEYSNSETQQKYVSQQLNDDRQAVQSETIDRYIDARQRPWYQAAVQAQGPVWTEVYTSISAVEGHSLAINASRPIDDPEGQLQGVVSVILDLGQISQLLETIEFSPSGQIFILEADGNLIGSSDGNNPVYVNGDEIGRLPATQSQNQLIREAAQYLQTFLQGNFNAVDQALKLEFDLNGQRQFLQVTPIQAGEQLEWFVVVVAPESDFMGQIYAHTRNTLWLCLGAVALAIGSSILTARWMTKPLIQLNQAAKSMAQGQWKPEERRATITTAQTREINDLAHSFSQMALQLNASFAALQASEGQFRSMAANVPGCIFRYALRADGSDAVSYASPGCYDLWEVKAHDIERNVAVIWDMIHPEDLPTLRTTIADSARTLQTWHKEWRITTPSGQEKWLRGAGNPTRYLNGDVIWVTVISDISDRKAAEQALKTQRDFNQLIAQITSRFVDVEPASLNAEIERALKDIGEMTGVDTSYIFDLNDAAQTFSMTYEWCRPTCSQNIAQSQEIPFAQFPWYMAMLKRRNTLNVTQVADLPEAAASDQANWQSFGIVSLLAVPLIHKSGVTGFIGFASFTQPIIWTDDDIQLLNVVAQTIANTQERTRAQAALVESEARWQFALDGSGEGVWDWDVRTKRVFYSHRWKDMLGYEEHEIGTRLEEWDSRVHPDDKAQCYNDLQSHFSGQTPVYQNEYRIRGKDNRYRWILDRGKVIEWSEEGQPLRIIGTHTDITERKQAEKQLQDLTDRLGLAVQAAEMGIWDWDILNNRLEWDERIYELYGIRPGDFDGAFAAWEAVVHPEDLPRCQAVTQQALRGEGGSPLEFRVLHPDGSILHIESHFLVQQDAEGRPLRMIGVNLDITQRKQAEAQMIHNALHDSLTDLPNRSLLTKRLELALQRVQRSSSYCFAVLFLDLDRFKVINDSLGHLIGDQLLITVAHKLHNIIRPTDVAARLGGDEFVILLEHITDIQAVVQVAERLLTEFEGPINVDGHEVFITTSIGIVWGSAAYTSAADLLRDADIALYRAKGQGRARYEIFDAEMHTQAVKRMTLEHNLREAIDQQAFAAYYQPIFVLQTQQLVGFEALIRWPHPTQGFISPADFIPLAEETGMILPISRWMLRTVCEQITLWRQRFPDKKDLRVSVNLSGKDLLQPGLIDTIRQILYQTQAPATALTLEITESVLIENVEDTIDLLRQLRSDGIRISIDDFGTGYSSLSYLYNLPADYLKIDKSFVGNMHLDDRNHKIVQTVINLSDQLQLAAIAEGIETQNQLKWLKALHCELGQGYLFSHPLAPEAATALLAKSDFFQIKNNEITNG
jgi:diguanylate cyclase (GGDEF)-like protein/PAS domain S-box-containing protein